MSVDPASAGAASLGAAAGGDLSALIAAELTSLAADAQALRGILVENAVISAKVLPSNGLTDLLEVFGLRVAASLPPTVRPGDVITVQVTDFDADRILLQILGSGAQAAVETGSGATPYASAGGTSSGVATGTNAPAPPEASGALALPPPAVPPASAAGSAATMSTAASRAAIAGADPNASHAPASGALRAPIAPAGEPTTIEARLVATRAALATRLPDVPPADDDATAHAAPAAPPLGGSRFVAPPPIVARGAAPSAAASVAPGAAAPQRASGLNAYAEPVALLRALRIAVTPTTVAAARMALDHPEQLPTSLAALERALPQNADDPSVATLRTLLAFVGRIEPDSPALAAQLAAYVDHVVAGAEPKLAVLLAALRSGAELPEPAAPNASGAPANAPQEAATNGGAQAPDAASLPAAVAAERGAALDANLKQTMLALAADPATPDGLAPALGNALTALTSVQVNAAQMLAARPDGLAFTVPLATANGPASAHIRVQRDPSESRAKAGEPANFRIAFVLETAHYGTVAIDVVTVGRDVTVDVRTEAAPAMRAFRDALGRLTDRLETLRYRVASAGASVGTTTTIAVDTPAARPADPAATVDRSA
ncbi:MAG TPA: hypothetical protein VFB22_13400 [Candidatus Baltobacteraceae bacterium]|nr:hypothetical protein [Candidatus Baltobacteraceae bacterium]